VTPNDSQLIARSIGGDRIAFGELVRRYQDRLYHTAYRLIGNAEDAQDVVQDSFLNAYLSLHQFKGDARFFTWLYRIAVNAAISTKRKRRAVLSADAPGGAAGAEAHDVSYGSQPGAAVEREEDERRLTNALNAISPEHRAVLVLKEIEGRKYETIAEVLGVPIGTVRSRLHRARLELRDRLIRAGDAEL
jgi:RNA polymerase sigma-70 factor (ECF subfamily)